MNRLLGAGCALLFLVLAAVSATSPPRASAALPAPTLRFPVSGVQLSEWTVGLSWTLPQGAEAYHLEVIPFNREGPGVHLIRPAANSFTIPGPPLWTLLLPDLTYSWRVRASTQVTLDEGAETWGPWSETWTFRTPHVTSAGLQPVMPNEGAQRALALPVTLEWSHPDPAVWFFEMQVSHDPAFTTDPATATSFVWWNYVHAGAATLNKSWRTLPLEAGWIYFWRVRPRVQGDGAELAWGPTWSFRTAPPGPVIAFQSTNAQSEQDYGLVAITPDGGGWMPLLARAGYNDRDVSWSPDGKWIIFTSNRGDSSAPDPPPTATAIFVMNVDGSGLTRLTDHVDEASHPVWSPDGSRIAYVARRNGNREIWMMNADGSRQANLTSHPASDVHPTWSPDGRQIGFASDREGNWEIYVLNLTGGVPTNITNYQGDDEDPAWSPDGKRIAFRTFRDAPLGSIYLMNTDGSDPVRLARDALHDRQPAWSPDGKRIAFVRGHDIHLINTDGTAHHQLTYSAPHAWNHYPAWTYFP